MAFQVDIKDEAMFKREILETRDTLQGALYKVITAARSTLACQCHADGNRVHAHQHYAHPSVISPHAISVHANM